MGPVLPGSARTTQPIRRASQPSQQSVQSVAHRHGIKARTGATWRKRPTTQHDHAARGDGAPTGPDGAEPGRGSGGRSLPPAHAAAARRGPLRPAGHDATPDALTCRRGGIQALPRLCQRHGLRRLPRTEKGQSPAKKKGKASPIGSLPVDVAQGQTGPGRGYWFGAVERTRQGAFAALPPRATRLRAAELRRRVLPAVPDTAPTVLPDKGVPCTWQAHEGFPGGHGFDRVCRASGVEHRRAQPAHPWTTGPVERRNRPLQEAPGLRSPYQTTERRNEHLPALLLACHHARRLQTSRGLTPPEFVCAQQQKNPAIFPRDPTQLTRGLYS